MSLSCLQRGTVDFNLIEEDIKRIHQKLLSEGADALTTCLLIDKEEDYFEIKTYIRQGEKYSLNTIKFNVKKALNLPSDVDKKLQEDGKVELRIYESTNNTQGSE